MIEFDALKKMRIISTKTQFVGVIGLFNTPPLALAFPKCSQTPSGQYSCATFHHTRAPHMVLRCRALCSCLTHMHAFDTTGNPWLGWCV